MTARNTEQRDRVPLRDARLQCLTMTVETRGFFSLGTGRGFPSRKPVWLIEKFHGGGMARCPRPMSTQLGR